MDVHIHKVFDRIAASSPGAFALVSERGGLTSGESNDRAECLASFLRSQGVGVGAYVPSCPTLAVVRRPYFDAMRLKAGHEHGRRRRFAELAEEIAGKAASHLTTESDV